MLVEEYRLHAELFGGGRFALFPLFVAVLVGGGVWLLQMTGTALGAIVAGLFVLVLFFGLQVGTIGLVGRDAMRDVLGDVTLLVFAARTLPVSRRRLLSTFLLKDLAYYGVFVLTPLVVGFVPVALAGGMTVGTLGLLWATLLGTFAFGAAASLTLAGIATRSKIALAIVLAAIAAGLVLAPSVAILATPYAIYDNPTLTTAVTGTTPLLVVLVAGPLLFAPPTDTSVRRVENDRYEQLCKLGGSMTARPLLEVLRSSGSVWKVAFSLGVLFAVTALLLDRLVAATGLQPSAGVAFGTLLGLGTFTTYNWVTQFDEPREYLRYPEAMDAVFAGKRRAFLVLSVPTGLAYLALAAVWYPATDLLAGVVVFPLVAVYVFGLTAYITGLSPNELLFDTPLFAVYGGALAAVAVPLLVAALAYGDAPLETTLVAFAIAGAAAAVGIVLARRTGQRWHDRLRTTN